MTLFNKYLTFFSLFLIKWVFAGDKIYKLDRIGNCFENATGNTMDFSKLTKINEMKGFKITGAIVVNNDIKERLCMEIEVHKCNIHGTECEKFNQFMYKDFCPLLIENMYVGDAFSKITTPSLTCPIKKGVYNATGVLVNMSRVDLLPFDGQKWLLYMKFCEGDGVSKDPSKFRPLGCWFLQMYRTTISYKKRN